MTDGPISSWERLYHLLEPEKLPWNAGKPDPELVKLVESGFLKPGPALEVGSGLGYDAVFSLPEFVVLRPREGEPPGPVFILQRVPEEKAGKNRMHLDVHPDLGQAGRGVSVGPLGGRPAAARPLEKSGK